MAGGAIKEVQATHDYEGKAWTVACLCAAWCGVCRAYAAEFAALERKFPQVHFEWVDVEDQEQLVGDVDVQTFPTLLIASSDGARFLGPLLPQVTVLEKLLQSYLQGAPAASSLPEQADGLWMRMQGQWQ